jgi:hypothetical protein
MLLTRIWEVPALNLTQGVHYLQVLNSLCSFDISVFHVTECRVGINHILVGMIINPKNGL